MTHNRYKSPSFYHFIYVKYPRKVRSRDRKQVNILEAERGDSWGTNALKVAQVSGGHENI